MKKLYCIGIGGIGVSALARYYAHQGWEVSGSDVADSEIVQELQQEGITVHIGESQESNVPSGVSMVVYSPAVPDTDVERVAAKGTKARVLSYPEALGELTKQHWTIAVAGTHGKSTTTAMMALMMEKAGLDPTVIIGTKLKEFGNKNFRAGKSKYLLIEADEWAASFLNHWPQLLVITNIEKEHLDFFRDKEHILQTYQEFLDHVPDDGYVVLNNDDPDSLKLISRAAHAECFSLQQKESVAIAKKLQVPGEHNVANGLAVLAAARQLGVPDTTTLDALAMYKGAWRRFEQKVVQLNNSNTLLISDYAHHPTEIHTLLRGTREHFADKKLTVVFQPHQYQRTQYLFDRFVEVLSKAPCDELVITDIFDVAGRETAELRQAVSGKKLATAVKKAAEGTDLVVRYVPFAFEKLHLDLEQHSEADDVVMLVGAGTIDTVFRDMR